jgi:hypothetical protein
MQEQLELTSPAGSTGGRRTRRPAAGPSAGGPTQAGRARANRQRPAGGDDRRHPPSVARLSEETRRTGREGVAMARRELRRAMGSGVDSSDTGSTRSAA